MENINWRNAAQEDYIYVIVKQTQVIFTIMVRIFSSRNSALSTLGIEFQFFFNNRFKNFPNRAKDKKISKNDGKSNFFCKE